MKCIVEFGKPQNALKDQNAPCGVSGKHVCTSAKKAAELANQLLFVLGERSPETTTRYFQPSRRNPRLTYWHNDRSFWITVSLLDGVSRGDYAGTKDAK